MAALPVRLLYVILDRYGLPVGLPYLLESAASRDLHNANEDQPDRSPHRVVEYRVNQ